MSSRIDDRIRQDEVKLFDMMGAKAAQSGAGRASRLRAALQLLRPEDRQLVLSAFDEASRPMTAHEVEKALMQTGITFRDRKAAVAALKGFDIVMVRPK